MTNIRKDSENVLNPELIEVSLNELAEYSEEFLRLRDAINDAHYNDVSVLLKRKSELESLISIMESDAIMSIQGEGKNAHVVIDGRVCAMTNDTQRKAYTKTIAVEERQELAFIEGELAAERNKLEGWKLEMETVVEAARSARSRAELQSRLLQYMSGKE